LTCSVIDSSKKAEAGQGEWLLIIWSLTQPEKKGLTIVWSLKVQKRQKQVRRVAVNHSVTHTTREERADNCLVVKSSRKKARRRPGEQPLIVWSKIQTEKKGPMIIWPLKV